ncbi:MAG: monooxygenase, partial [Acidobacteriota bacterium]|nr:monooxygenase [Acidobacteriota bacterium]
MLKRLPTWIVALALFALITPAKALAHGEAGDEPFLKDLTTAFYDVNISPNVIHVGEPVTITGSVRVLDTWPYT